MKRITKSQFMPRLNIFNTLSKRIIVKNVEQKDSIEKTILSNFSLFFLFNKPITGAKIIVKTMDNKPFKKGAENKANA
jgi:hypothetical protein